MPSLVTKMLSRSSLPVNSSAATYRLGHTVLAMSSIYCQLQQGNMQQPKDQSSGEGERRNHAQKKDETEQEREWK